jgi:hypothetical protein
MRAIFALLQFNDVDVLSISNAFSTFLSLSSKTFENRVNKKRYFTCPSAGFGSFSCRGSGSGSAGSKGCATGGFRHGCGTVG